MKPYTLHTFKHTVPDDGTKGWCAAVGFFDGVHLGHRYLLQQVKAEAAARGLLPMAVTFEEHPRLALTPTRYWPELLTTNKEKLALLRQEGLAACAVLHFDHAMSMLTSQEFMQKILGEGLGVKCLLVGYDHHFGSDLSAGFKDYVRQGRALGMEVLREQPYEQHDLRISSSATRRFLSGGNVEMARACLGRPYALSGTVVRGHHEGTALGFATANLRPDCAEQLVPGRGVYAAWGLLHGFRYPAMVNIGWRPTLDNGTDQTIEAHLLDYEGGDLYGEGLQLQFMYRVRDEKRFDSRDDLVAQLQVDARHVKSLLQS